MAKYIQLNEAAEQLGISVDELNQLRENNEVRAFRDGSTWKFKSDDLDQLAVTLRERNAESGGLGLGEESPDEGGDSILLSEHELGGGVSSSSTIIGRHAGEEDDDIPLAGDDEAAGRSDVTLDDTSDDDLSLDSGLTLQDDGLDTLDVDFEANDKTKAKSDAPEESGLSLSTEDSGLDLAQDSGLGLASGSDIAIAADSDKLGASSSADDDDELTIGGSALDLAGDDDDDLVLGGTGSDVSSGVGDSGISLMDPADSGLDLEEATLDLGSGIGGESLELGEDDLVTLGGEQADLSAATQLGNEEDFMLTPLEDAEDESGSGSQVIALDAGEGFDDAVATMPIGGDAMAMLEEDLGGGFGPATPVGMAAPQQQVVTIQVPEAPYSVWNVVSLFVCICVLCLVGIMMFDVVRNIWSWDQPYDTNSSILDAVAQMFDL